MSGNQVIEINLNDILPNRFQPRIKFHEKNINELADSIREHGVIQPIVVRKISDKYEIIAGERRYKASVLANKTTIPALIVNLNDQDAAEVALIENVQRQDLTPIEEAVSYKKILDMGMTQEQLASKLGKTQSTVANKLRLLNLDEQVQEALLEQKISERHARSLLKLPTNEDQVKILNRIIQERLTVRKTDQAIREYMEKQSEPKEEIEVLDLEEKENEEDMNENNFNIPNTTIEGDGIPSGQVNNTMNQTIPEVGATPVTPVTNPGFMDVNKIENQAQDIFTEAPKADVENLLHQDASMVQEEPKEEAPTGKFFTMMSGQKPNENFVEDIEKVETNMDFMPQEETPAPQYNFDSFFNNNYVDTPKPIEQVEQKPIVEEQPVMPTPAPQETISQSFGINPEMIQSTPPVEPQPEVTPTSEPVMPTVTPVMPETPVENVPQPQVSEVSMPTFEEPSVEPISPVAPMMEEKPMTDFGVNFNVAPQSPVQQTTETPQDLGFNVDFRNLTPNSAPEVAQSMPAFEPQPEVTPMSEPVMPTVTPVVPEAPVENVVPTFNPTYTEPTVNVQPTQSPVMQQPMAAEPSVSPVQPAPAEQSNIRSAIDIIRNCSSQLNALGFNVELEEYDLENMYQVIFKINK